MLTGVRSVLFCDEVVKHGNGGVDYLGVHGDIISISTRPGLLTGHVCITFETDRKRSPVTITCKGPGADLVAPFEIPAGWNTAGVNLPVGAFIDEEGPMFVTVKGPGAAKPIKTKFLVKFHDQARELPPEEAAEIKRQMEAVRQQTGALQ